MEKSYRAELVGVFGCPVDENPTVVLEEAAFRALGLNYRYLTIEVKPEGLSTAMKALTAMNMKGVNLTIPHKCEVLRHLDELSEAAAIIGAVNTVVVKSGRLFGENTDGKGFLTSLKEADVPFAGKKAVLLGAGGAARAIAVELALAGVKRITVVNRSEARGRELAALIAEKTPASADYAPWRGDYKIPADTSVVINATSVGMYPNCDQRPAVDYDTFTPCMTACDVITNRPHTLFLREAEKRGAASVDGLGMLVNQGAINFTLWTGLPAPIGVMKQSISDEFGV